jgi:hypothetical protein
MPIPEARETGRYVDDVVKIRTNEKGTAAL